MARLHRVFGDKAGPEALGILIPPGSRTVVVVRPRALPWDLLLIEPLTDATAAIRFRDFAREEAEATAEAFARALDEWGAGGTGGVEAALAPGSLFQCVIGVIGRFHLTACPRTPGQPYRPMVFGTLGEAARAAVEIQSILCPASGVRQELYFNTRNFARP